MLNRLTENKIILVTRRTRLDELITRFNTVGQAKFYVEQLGADFSDYLAEHEQYTTAVSNATTILSQLGRLQIVHREFLPNFIFGEQDTVVVLGQDGLVANTLKYLTEQSVIGVNPDPRRWDGILVPFSVSCLSKIVPEVFTSKRSIKNVTMAQASLNDGQTLFAVNDFFIGVKSHCSARYTLQLGKEQEAQSSSGVIVSTGLGSTGWFKSLMAGALGIASKVTGMDLHTDIQQQFHWDAQFLYFTVREPFPSNSSSANLVFGKITPGQPLCISSQMAECGVIFSDGIESDYLEFNSGAQATVSIAKKTGHLVV